MKAVRVTCILPSLPDGSGKLEDPFLANETADYIGSVVSSTEGKDIPSELLCNLLEAFQNAALNASGNTTGRAVSTIWAPTSSLHAPSCG
jgi:hypothetical protein